MQILPVLTLRFKKGLANIQDFTTSFEVGYSKV